MQRGKKRKEKQDNVASEKEMTKQDEIIWQVRRIKEEEKAVENERRKLKKMR